MAEQQNAGSLARKMAKVMGAVERVGKNGTNDFHKYSYTTEADIADVIRKLMAENGIAFFPSVVANSVERFEVKGGNAVSRLWLSTKFIDTETGEMFESLWPGEGQDNADKGLYKAITGAEKYALMKTFLVPTGDDPEKENDTEKGARQAGRSNQNQQQAQNQRPAGAPTPNGATQPKPTLPLPAAKGENLSESIYEEQAAGGQDQPKIISKPQLDRLFAIATNKGWSTEDAKGIIHAAGFASSKDITKDKYDAICKTLEDGPPVKEPAHVGS